MKPAIILFSILVLGGAIVWLIDKLFYHHNDTDREGNDNDLASNSDTHAQGCADEGCGLRSICPSEQILTGQCKQEITYYDDEELDDFMGREADSYSPEEEEQWRDVLYTLQPADLLGWGQSVKHRGLVMPAAIRDEFMLLAGEQHAASMQ